MPTNKNSIFTTSLTIASLSLTACCLIWWNYTNFKQETFRLQRELQNDLTTELAKANYDAIYNSFIAIFDTSDLHSPENLVILNPDISNQIRTLSKNLPKLIGHNHDSINSQDLDLNFSIEIDSLFNPDINSTSLFSYDNLPVHFEPIHMNAVNKDIEILNNDSLRIKQVENSKKSYDYLDIDKLRLEWENSLNSNKEIIDLFKKKLKEKQYPFTIAETLNKGEEGLKISGTKGSKTDTIDLLIGNYKWTVTKTNFPTILLSVLLFGLTSCTFWILMNSRKKQEQLIVLKNEFISNMTHELKTPISTVGVALEAISTFGKELDKDKTNEYLDISQQELGRLSLLVDKVLKMASYDSDHSLIKMVELDLRQIIEKILLSMKLQFSNKNAEIHFTNSLESAKILGDPVHISNVIYNIIDNALKYSESKVYLDIELIDSNKNYVMIFKDKGKGIPIEFLDKVFDRFFRTPENNRHNVKGHGLGLSYAKDIVEKHNGNISIDSTLGKGTEVTIKIPQYGSL